MSSQKNISYHRQHGQELRCQYNGKRQLLYFLIELCKRELIPLYKYLFKVNSIRTPERLQTLLLCLIVYFKDVFTYNLNVNVLVKSLWLILRKKGFNLCLSVECFTTKNRNTNDICMMWHHLYNLKNVKNSHGGMLLLLKLTKVIFFHGCFSRF